MGAEEPTASLLDLARRNRQPIGAQCTFRNLLPDPSIEELLDNTGKDSKGQPRGEGLPYRATATTLSEAFKLTIKPGTVSRHIRGECSC